MRRQFTIDPTEERFNVEAGRGQMRERIRLNTNVSPALTGGDVDARWEDAESSGDETVCGSMMTPDQNMVDEFGGAFGIYYDDTDELYLGTKEFDRDRHRWELDPASAEDYRDRARMFGKA